MTTHYKVMRPVTPADLDSPSTIAQILRMIPHEGYVTFEQFKKTDRSRADRGVKHACSIGVLKRISPHERVLGLDSVKFWCTQLNKSGHKNSKPGYGTKNAYLNHISKFDEWLPGRSFKSYKNVMLDGIVTRQAFTKSFANVEELMEYCNESDYGTKTAQRAIREYVTNQEKGIMTLSAYSLAQSAIKSYFNTNDIVLALPKPRKQRSEQAPDDDPMTLEDFYRMLQNGKPSITMRTIALIKFQSGMDSSTLTDRFNYEGYSQIVKYFRTDDHMSWNLEMCPVPIKLVRVKTDVSYTTFLEHDAIAQLQEYLTWKEMKYSKQNISKPLFMTKQNTPIHPMWLSKNFSEVAVRAGVQEKVSHKLYRILAHDVRHLLKSTLIISGCAQYAADHVLGHAPRDTYEKQATLYPEELRAEYAKASSRLNIFSQIEGSLNTADDPASLHARIIELEDEIWASKQYKIEHDLINRGRLRIIDEKAKELKHLQYLFDSLPESVKKRMEEQIEDLINLEELNKLEEPDSAEDIEKRIADKREDSDKLEEPDSAEDIEKRIADNLEDSDKLEDSDSAD